MIDGRIEESLVVRFLFFTFLDFNPFCLSGSPVFKDCKDAYKKKGKAVFGAIFGTYRMQGPGLVAQLIQVIDKA